MILVVTQRTRKPIGMQTVRTVLVRFLMGMRSLWRPGPKAICVTLWQRTWLPFVCVLRLCVEDGLKVRAN
jgi:hypothetical protein